MDASEIFGDDCCTRNGHVLVEADHVFGQSIPKGYYCRVCGYGPINEKDKQ